MLRPRTTTPKRPRTASGAAAKSPKEAAIHLVRLEFDLSRLEMGIEQAEDRLRAYTTELEEKRKQRQRLMAQLTR